MSCQTSCLGWRWLAFVQDMRHTLRSLQQPSRNLSQVMLSQPRNAAGGTFTGSTGRLFHTKMIALLQQPSIQMPTSPHDTSNQSHLNCHLSISSTCRTGSIGLLRCSSALMKPLPLSGSLVHRDFEKFICCAGCWKNSSCSSSSSQQVTVRIQFAGSSSSTSWALCMQDEYDLHS